MSLRYGILGGAFNPPHRAHVELAESARVQLDLDRVLLVPCGGHPFKAGGVLAPVEHRVEMTRLAIAGCAGLELSTIDATRDGVSYTVETLAELTRLCPEQEPVLLLGADLIGELHLWNRWQELIQLAHLAIFPRAGGDHWLERSPAMRYLAPYRVAAPERLTRTAAGYSWTLLATPHIEISSTAIRDHLITDCVSAAPPQLAAPVARYIELHQLYRNVNKEA